MRPPSVSSLSQPRNIVEHLLKGNHSRFVDRKNGTPFSTERSTAARPAGCRSSRGSGAEHPAQLIRTGHRAVPCSDRMSGSQCEPQHRHLRRHPNTCFRKTTLSTGQTTSAPGSKRRRPACSISVPPKSRSMRRFPSDRWNRRPSESRARSTSKADPRSSARGSTRLSA